MPKAGTLLEKVEIKLDAELKKGLSKFNDPAHMRLIIDVAKRTSFRVIYWSNGYKVKGFMVRKSLKGKLPGHYLEPRRLWRLRFAHARLRNSLDGKNGGLGLHRDCFPILRKCR